MLSPRAEAVTVERNGRGAPDASLGGRKRGCQAGTSCHRNWLKQETSLSVLFEGLFFSRKRASRPSIWVMSV